MEDATATDQVIDNDNNSDVVTDDLEEKVETEVEVTDEVGGEQIPSDGDTGEPKKPDAEAAKYSFKYREEKRARVALEQENAALKAQNEKPAEPKPEIPKIDDFDNTEAYNGAMAEYHEKLTDWKIAKNETTRDAKTKQTEHFNSLRELDSKFSDKADVAAEKYTDFYDIADSVKEQAEPILKEAILKSENSAEIVYHLGKNPELLKELSGSSPIDIAKEISKLDEQFIKSLSQKTVSKAPNPIKPVGGPGDTVGKKETTAQYVARKNKEEFGG